MLYSGDIAERIKLGREELGLTQAELAQRAGVSRATIARIESGGADSVSFGAMVRVLNAANWSIYLEKGIVASQQNPPFDMEEYLDSLYGDAR